jgi:hypothetical protein
MGAYLTAKDANGFDFLDDDPARFRATAASACICVHLWFHLGWRRCHASRRPWDFGFKATEPQMHTDDRVDELNRKMLATSLILASMTLDPSVC